MNKEFPDEHRVEPSGVRLQSQYPGVLNATGSITGNVYRFNGGGSILEVHQDDVPELLGKTFGGYSCCGSGAVPTPMFIRA